MKSILKLTVVACGFMLATIASSSTSKAIAPGHEGSCVETGKCGKTPGGVELIGFWREKTL